MPSTSGQYEGQYTVKRVEVGLSKDRLDNAEILLKVVEVTETFGKFISLKETVFEPSSPFRHACELHQILTSLSLEKRVLFVYSDGGPDHRLTYVYNCTTLLDLSVSEIRSQHWQNSPIPLVEKSC